MCEKLSERADKSEFDIYPYITHSALDIICETAMGKCINAQENGNSEYVRAVYRSAEIVFQVYLNLPYFIIPIVLLTKIKFLKKCKIPFFDKNNYPKQAGLFFRKYKLFNRHLFFT